MDTIEARHLTRTFGDFTAVDDISFHVAEGEFFGFLGPNGAGKSTTINILCTLLRPTSGQVFVNGIDVMKNPDAVRRSIGLDFQESTLDDRLTAAENLELHARIYNVPRSIWLPRRERLLHLVELWDRRNDIVRTFSGGMRRRLEVALWLDREPRPRAPARRGVGRRPSGSAYRRGARRADYLDQRSPTDIGGRLRKADRQSDSGSRGSRTPGGRSALPREVLTWYR